jgi:hypothetical protein
MSNGGSAEHELFRYTRGLDLRIYVLRVLPGATELWRITEAPGQPSHSIMETSFTGADEAAAFIAEVERTLTAGGWRPLDE